MTSVSWPIAIALKKLALCRLLPKLSGSPHRQARYAPGAASESQPPRRAAHPGAARASRIWHPGRRSFVCRKCCDLAYTSQREGKKMRPLSKAIRVRLAGCRRGNRNARLETGARLAPSRPRKATSAMLGHRPADGRCILYSHMEAATHPSVAGRGTATKSIGCGYFGTTANCL